MLGVEEIAHLFEGCRRQELASASMAVLAEPCRQRCGLLQRRRYFWLSADQYAADRRHVQRQLAQLGGGDGFAKRRIRQRLAQISRSAAPRHLRRRSGRRAPNGGIERQQHRHGQRPLVVLELVEIAQRDAEPSAQAPPGCSRRSSRRRFSRTPMKAFFIAALPTLQTLGICVDPLRKTTLFQPFSV